MKKEVRKKGASTVTLLKYFGMAMSAVVIVLLILYWRDVKNNTFLERNYLARDISLLLTAAYASPGDLTYCYYPVGEEGIGARPVDIVTESMLDGPLRGRFDYLIGNSRVVVADSSSGGGSLVRGATYFYAENVDKPLQQVKIADNDARTLAVLQVIKDDSSVRVVTKKRGEDASPCKP